MHHGVHCEKHVFKAVVSQLAACTNWVKSMAIITVHALVAGHWLLGTLNADFVE
jgi:hypothetical protein